MRHGKRFNHLGRTSTHRKAMLSNMASSLIMHKRISTTLAKAKELRKYVEPLITRSKEDTTHSRRTVFSYLQDKESLKVLFEEVSEKVQSRPGGYTRIIKTGNRLGDNAEMCIIELVDYNELLLAEAEEGKSKKKTRRRGKKTTSSQPSSQKQEASSDAQSKDEVKASESTEKKEAKAESKTETQPKAQKEEDQSSDESKKDDEKKEEK